MAICAEKEKRYVKIVWAGPTAEVITAGDRIVRLREREVLSDPMDSSVAEYLDMGDEEFKLKYTTGYLCKHKISSGLIICKNRGEKYTNWKKDSELSPSKMITWGLCLRKMKPDTRTDFGGIYLNVSNCNFSNNDQWVLEDIDINLKRQKPWAKDRQPESNMLNGDDNDISLSVSRLPSVGVPNLTIVKGQSQIDFHPRE